MKTKQRMPAANPSTGAGPGARLRALGLELPIVPKPLGNYVEVSQAGSLLFISGRLPVANGKLTITGRLGDSLSVEQGREAARLAAMNALAAVQEHLGDRFSEEMKTHESQLTRYPAQSWIVAPFRAAALAQGRTDLVALWAGQSAPLVRHRKVDDLFTSLVNETENVFRSRSAHESNV